MNGHDVKITKMFLSPGEIVLAESPVEVTTVLGSCIAITLFAKQRRVGAICHAVLPSGKDRQLGKYVDQTLPLMLEFFHQKKIARRGLVAKLFGGSDMFPPPASMASSRTIGSQNVSMAYRCLQEHGLAVAVADVGGILGRKMVFYSHSGEVFIKKIKKEQFTSLVSPRNGIAGRKITSTDRKDR